MITYLEGFALGIYLAFMMMGGSFIGALLFDVFARRAIAKKAKREDLSQ